ncbi:MAG: CapA family protein [Deltaproteobacteria bacterium]|jgi:poly-gamma-glutamate capsule biosynthesis protein CapA/YwtB (metallophosphatase superfamily)|nr:CapA family protein [Deltaproteobacteria bacterium]
MIKEHPAHHSKGLGNAGAVFLVLFSLLIIFTACGASGLGSEPSQTQNPAAPAPDRPVGVAMMGDIMMGTENLLPPDGGVGFFEDVKPFLKNQDFVFGNLEGPLTDRGSSTKDTSTGRSFSFRTPPSYGRFLKEADFNIVSLANNHANDYGPAGKAQTIQVLESLGIAHTGAPGQLTAVDSVSGRKAVFIGLAPNQGCQNINDVPAAAALVKKAKADYQSALVFVSVHGGAEGTAAMDMPLGPEMYLGEKRGDLRKLATALIDNGADLIIGHGPHVPRGVEIYKGRLIVYSLGNFATASGINVRGATGLAPLVLAELASDGRVLDYRIISFRQQPNRGPKLDKTDEARKVMENLTEKLAAKIKVQGR